MTLAFSAIAFGLALLVWSAGRFVEGAASTARHFGMPPLLIGMVIVGFGTSAPEMVVSALAASQGNPGIALGNAYGSNITNIALILGLTALISPIAVHSLFLIGYGFRGPGRINRVEGMALLACYGGYTAYLVGTLFSR